MLTSNMCHDQQLDCIPGNGNHQSFGIYPVRIPVMDDSRILVIYQHLLYSHHNILVGGLEHGFYDFPYIGNVTIPTDELRHFSEG